MGILSVVLGGGYLLTSARARRLVASAQRPAPGGGPAPDGSAPAGAGQRGRRSDLGGLPPVRRPRRGRGLLRRHDPSGRAGGLHPRRRVGPRSCGARPHRLHALHAARLPRGRPRPAHHPAGGGPGDRRAPRRGFRHRRARGARSPQRLAHLRVRRASRADRGRPRRDTSRCSPHLRLRSGWACARAFARPRCRCRPGRWSACTPTGWRRPGPSAASWAAHDSATSSRSWAAARPPRSLLDHVAREARLVTDDMATVVLTPTAGVTAGGFRCRAARDRCRRGPGHTRAGVPGGMRRARFRTCRGRSPRSRRSPMCTEGRSCTWSSGSEARASTSCRGTWRAWRPHLAGRRAPRDDGSHLLGSCDRGYPGLGNLMRRFGLQGEDGLEGHRTLLRHVPTAFVVVMLAGVALPAQAMDADEGSPEPAVAIAEPQPAAPPAAEGPEGTPQDVQQDVQNARRRGERRARGATDARQARSSPTRPTDTDPDKGKSATEVPPAKSKGKPGSEPSAPPATGATPVRPAASNPGLTPPATPGASEPSPGSASSRPAAKGRRRPAGP